MRRASRSSRAPTAPTPTAGSFPLSLPKAFRIRRGECRTRSMKDLVRRAIAFLATLGSLPSDSPEERVRKAALILVALLIVPLATVWVVTYAILGLWWAAAIPFTYQVLSLIGLVLFFRSKNYRLFRASQLLLMLVLP